MLGSPLALRFGSLAWTMPLVAMMGALSMPGDARGAPPPPGAALDLDTVRSLASLSLACIDRPFPNKPSHVYESPDQVRPPEEWTPAFFGCFDHHSAVHGHWALVRVIRMFPGADSDGAIRSALDRHLSPDRLAKEAAFFQEERNRTFERPYGWGWILRLAAELHSFDDPDARRWSAAITPLARAIAGNLSDYLGRLTYPVREGVHPNTAFALTHAWDYAAVTADGELRKAIRDAAMRFFENDASCPIAWEPSGEDFLSPCLAEADLMRRVLPPARFARWIGRFLPELSSRSPAIQPPEIRDVRDPRIGHLIGLDFQRAWSLLGIAESLPPGDRRIAACRSLAARHREAGLSRMMGSGYGGEHWLATFALFLITAAGR